MKTDAERADYRFAARRDLEQYRETLQMVAHYDKRIERLRSKAERTVATWEADKVQADTQERHAENFAVALVDVVRENQDRQLDTAMLCHELQRKINAWTTGQEQMLLTDHYLFGLSLKKIATRSHYSDRQAKRIHRRALEKYGRKLLEEMSKKPEKSS